MTTSWIIWGGLFGLIGMAFFVYGRKQRSVVPLVCGLILMVFPYFISNTILMLFIGAVLIAAPYFVRM